MKGYDFLVIGGGIVGMSTAWQLQQRYAGARILLVEKENLLADHQTGHNSGVIHAGVYYQPGSLKADFCRRGSRQTIEFCREHGLPFERCGKLLVATDPAEYQRMDALEERCRQNGIETHRLSRDELTLREPRIVGMGALFVPATGITDYRRITAKMAELFQRLGGEIAMGAPVRRLMEGRDAIRVAVGPDQFEARYVVACGGLMADRLANMMGIAVDFQIVPFRGEYYRLPSRYSRIISHLIYPIPDPELPFLGVHLTRMIDGSVTVGPNAVLGWKREGYGRINFHAGDTLQMLRFPGFWKVARAHLRSGIGEAIDAFCKPLYLKRITKYCPSLKAADLRPWPAGIRAQAVMSDGTLVHDFLFAHSPRSLHVCNAPSPAATSAMPIGAHLCRMVAERFSL